MARTRRLFVAAMSVAAEKQKVKKYLLIDLGNVHWAHERVDELIEAGFEVWAFSDYSYTVRMPPQIRHVHSSEVGKNLADGFLLHKLFEAARDDATILVVVASKDKEMLTMGLVLKVKEPHCRYECVTSWEQLRPLLRE